MKWIVKSVILKLNILYRSTNQCGSSSHWVLILVFVKFIFSYFPFSSLSQTCTSGSLKILRALHPWWYPGYVAFPHIGFGNLQDTIDYSPNLQLFLWSESRQSRIFIFALVLNDLSTTPIPKRTRGCESIPYPLLGLSWSRCYEGSKEQSSSWYQFFWSNIPMLGNALFGLFWSVSGFILC